MFATGGSAGIIFGNAVVDLGLHVVAHFHVVLSLGAIVSFFSGIVLNGEKIVGTKDLLFSSSRSLSLFRLRLICIWYSSYLLPNACLRILILCQDEYHPFQTCMRRLPRAEPCIGSRCKPQVTRMTPNPFRVAACSTLNPKP